MDKLIQKYYCEYKQFIKNDNLPNFTIIYDTSKAHIENSFAFIDADNFASGKINLFINKELFSFKESYYKSILFHEFTHILDGTFTFNGIKADHEKFCKMMSTYSEFHASQIELLCSLGYKTIKPITHKFQMNKKIYFKNEMIDVNNYLIYPLADATVILGKDQNAYKDLSEKEYNKKYIQAEKSVLYFLGKYNICDNFADRKPYNFFEEFCVFKNDILSIYKSLKIKDFDKISINVDIFMNHYLEFFKN